jgi:hypothetical protein
MYIISEAVLQLEDKVSVFFVCVFTQLPLHKVVEVKAVPKRPEEVVLTTTKLAPKVFKW